MRFVLLNVNTFHRRRHTTLGSLGNDDGDRNENGRKAIGLDPVYMEWGTPVYWGRFLLFCVLQSVKTKETYPSRPGSLTPCKQGLRLAKQQLCTCITLFCTFLYRLCIACKPQTYFRSSLLSVRKITEEEGREATTGNTSAVRRLFLHHYDVKLPNFTFC